MALVTYEDIMCANDEITVFFTLFGAHLTLANLVCSEPNRSTTNFSEFLLSFCSPCCNSMIIPKKAKKEQMCSSCWQSYPLTNVDPDFSWAPNLRYDYKPLLTEFLHKNLNYNGNSDPIGNLIAAQIATPLLADLSSYLWINTSAHGDEITETLYGDVMHVLNKLDEELKSTNLFK